MSGNIPDDFSRQSFLGSQENLTRCRIGIVGLGGGGSHIVQQLAHLGFSRYALFDSDAIDASNLNRLIGGTQNDVRKKLPKIEIARRTIRQIRPKAEITSVKAPWQEHPELLRSCDLVFGCVDGFDQRRQLEAATRRALIPLIDIGMDVFKAEDGSYAVAGQVILSMPGCPCMTCLGFLNERTLAREAERYGAAGHKPQVVWPNGVLASSAVGVAVDLFTDWSRSLRAHVYLSYRANDGTMVPHARLPYVSAGPCPHYPIEECGAPVFKPL